ncbi:MAG: hypothetical protein GX845_02125 [Erysipelothrix sp.]|jgi:hypothetical protein|nr:hypothetical protein [Erysipelothrix sp.]
MTVQHMVATIAGGFLFPFLIRLMWGKLVDNFGTFGGWMAALFIVGTTWAINHGAGMIIQGAEGAAWIDMGFAAGIGLLVASVVRGGNFGKAVPNLLAALVGGALGGLILSFFLF